MTGLVLLVVGKKMLLVRFQDGYERDLRSKKLVTITVDKIPNTKEDEVPTISAIYDDMVGL